MIWDKIKSPQKRVERAMRKLFQKREAQFWGILGLGMGLIQVGDGCHYSEADVPTMATDTINIYFSGPFVMTLTEAQCIGVLAHEISHPALRHKQRLAYLDDHDLANMAADYELNLDLVDVGLELPDGCLVDERFRGMAAEQIANVLRRENEQDVDDGRGNGQPGQGEPRHQPQSGSMMEPTHDDGTPLTSAEQAELTERWDEKVNQALSAARKAGTFGGKDVPSSLQSVKETRGHNSLVDWRQPLRAFIDQLGSTESTWNRLSRRGMAHGMVWQGEEVIRPSLIAWCIDVSGSMDKTKNRQALVEAQAALDDMACDAIELIYVDTTIKRVERYVTGETIVLQDGTGGGTDFASVMTYLANADDYAACVFVTDGQTSSWGDDPNIPTLWAITDSQRATDALAPPFGEKLCLYTS